ncbi:MAG: methyl-accepting chemotaxis protein [Clostridiales bacterium]|nr:methyl-accepting chemotaxis protein [Clostridiales bacterium]
MKMRTIVLGGFIIVAVFGTMLGITGFISNNMLLKKSNELFVMGKVNNDICSVLKTHYDWRHGLSMAVLDNQEFTGSLDPDTCALGKWLESDDAKNITDPEFNLLLSQIKTPHNEIHTKASTIIDDLNAGNNKAAYEMFDTEVLAVTKEVISGLSMLSERYSTLVNEKTEESVALGNKVDVITAILMLIAAIVSITLALTITSYIVTPLHHLTNFMKNASTEGNLVFCQSDIEEVKKCSNRRDEIGVCVVSSNSFIEHVVNISETLENIADGDLTKELSLLSEKDTLGISLQKVNDRLNSMFAEINFSTAQVNTGAKQVADGAQTLAQGSTQQAAAIDQLSSSIADITEKTKTNADKAEEATKLANTIRGNAEKSSTQMNNMMSAVEDINQASQSIGQVIKVIDDIAFQTNILALNAAVEAARAGQHGKGFAVVAEEVRNLAAKSADAAKETGALIQNSIEKAKLGSQIACETAVSLTDIVSGINESSRLIGEIAQSSEDQSTDIGQINIGIAQVAQVVQQNSATAEQSAAASEEMSSQSNILQELAAQFRLHNNITGKYNKAINAAIAPSQNRLPAYSGSSSHIGSDGMGKY